MTDETVNQFLFRTASLLLLDELADDNHYWSDVRAFYLSHKNHKISSLTFKQRNWLIKIRDGLIDEAAKDRGGGDEDSTYY